MINEQPNRIRTAAYHPVDWQPAPPPAVAYPPVHWQPPPPPAVAYPPVHWQAIQAHSAGYPPATPPAHRGPTARPKHHSDTILATALAALVAAAGLVTAASSTSPDGHWGSVAAVRWVETGLGSLLSPQGTAGREIIAAGIDTPTTNL